MKLRIELETVFQILWDNINNKSVGRLFSQNGFKGINIYNQPIFGSWEEMIANRSLVESGNVRLLLSPESAMGMAQGYDNPKINASKFESKYGETIEQNPNGRIIHPEFPVQLPTKVKQGTFYVPNGWSVQWMWSRLYERCQKFDVDPKELICYSNFGFPSHCKLSGQASIPKLPHIHFFYKKGCLPEEFFGNDS